MPLVIPFPAGYGQQFQREVEILLIDIERELKSTFTSEAFEKNKRHIVDEFRSRIERLWKKLMSLL